MDVTNSTEALPTVRVDAVYAPKRASWLIDELWQTAACGIIGGQPKCCKSWLGLDMAVSVASGTPCLGRFGVEEKGPALVYLAEDSLEQVRDRVGAIGRGRGLTLAQLDVTLITSPTLRLDTVNDQERLQKTVAEIRPRLLLLDPLVRLHRLDENNAREISGLLGYLRELQRLFDRPVRVLGYNRQRIPGNWKLMQENIKDPYHPGLLHTWFVTFGLWRADNKSELKMDALHRHAAMISTRGTGGKGAVTSGVSSFKEKMTLHDDRFLDVVHEPWWGTPTAVMMTVFPSVILQQQVNSVSTRHIQPNGHGSFDFVWTHFGFEDDTEEMTQRRLRQANLFGPAGFVSADDGEVIEFSQEGFEQKPSHRTVVELGGRAVGDTDHMVTETLIRGMYEYWRKVMEV